MANRLITFMQESFSCGDYANPNGGATEFSRWPSVGPSRRVTKIKWWKPANWVLFSSFIPSLRATPREGVLFRPAYTSVPSCLPARAALLTGTSPWGHGCLGYTPIPERYAQEMPRLFTDAGYRTHATALASLRIGWQHE